MMLLPDSHDEDALTPAFDDFVKLAGSSNHKPSREELLATAFSLCWDFRTHASSSKLLSHFDPRAVAIEHGGNSIAPFLGRPFRGSSGISEYFTLISELLDFRDMEFPVEDFTVDVEKSVVHCVGEAWFRWKKTDIEWKEKFTYRLVVVKQKIIWYEVWADPGSLVLAKMGLNVALDPKNVSAQDSL